MKHDYQCDFCSEFREHENDMELHESLCSFNPNYKSCYTCKHNYIGSIHEDHCMLTVITDKEFFKYSEFGDCLHHQIKMLSIKDPTLSHKIIPFKTYQEQQYSSLSNPLQDTFTTTIEVIFEIRPDIVSFKFDEQDIIVSRQINDRYFRITAIDLESALVKIDQGIYLNIRYKGKIYSNPNYSEPYNHYPSLNVIINKENYNKKWFEYKSKKEPQFQYFYFHEYMYTKGEITQEQYNEVYWQYVKHKQELESQIKEKQKITDVNYIIDDIIYKIQHLSLSNKADKIIILNIYEYISRDFSRSKRMKGMRYYIINYLETKQVEQYQLKIINELLNEKIENTNSKCSIKLWLFNLLDDLFMGYLSRKNKVKINDYI